MNKSWQVCVPYTILQISLALAYIYIYSIISITTIGPVLGISLNLIIFNNLSFCFLIFLCELEEIKIMEVLKNSVRWTKYFQPKLILPSKYQNHIYVE